MPRPEFDACDLLCLDLHLAEQIRAALPDVGTVEPLADAARALGDATRLTIATALRSGGQMCGCDMAWVVGQSQKLVSHHLRVLKSAGLVSSERRGRLVLYSLTERGTELVTVVLGPAVMSRAVDVSSDDG